MALGLLLLFIQTARAATPAQLEFFEERQWGQEAMGSRL
jgi:hypothetical protein